MRANSERANTFSRIPRMRMVIDEIVEELKRPTLDPMAIGLRFAELESNRRQMSEAEERLADANIALLDPVQKEKHAALIEAQRLAPLIGSAVRHPILKSRCRDVVVVILGSPSPETPWGFSLFGTYLGECPDRRSLLELP